MFIAPSLFIAKKLQAAIPSCHDSVRYMPHGVNIPASGRLNANGPLRVMFVGRFAAQRYPTILPEIDRELHPLGIEVNWVVIGSGPEEDVVRADREWNQSVRWTGQIPTRAVLNLYQGQDVFLLPSRLEGFPPVAGKFDIRRNAVRFAPSAIWGTAAGWLSPALQQQVGQAWLPNAFVRTVRSILGPRTH